MLRLAWLDKLELFALSGGSSLPDLPPTEEEVLLQTVASASGPNPDPRLTVLALRHFGKVAYLWVPFV